MAGDIAERAGRYVAGQNDDRDLAMKSIAKLRGDLKSVHAIWQVVVRENEVGPDRPSRSLVPALPRHLAPSPCDDLRH